MGTQAGSTRQHDGGPVVPEPRFRVGGRAEYVDPDPHPWARHPAPVGCVVVSRRYARHPEDWRSRWCYGVLLDDGEELEVPEEALRHVR